ncbi:hypothetical protein [uncultured Pseudomonas sp.]|uniref:hypothetical protein n=1 Tax=uncultured Pseudomonas sp. TaxID=114707 RepID=UPI00258AA637|nr:hypothetical protein [uncultured Pseudomonas sp.]
MSIIVMTDDDFEKNMQRLADQFHPLLAASFRARDTAQREALAQLQAEMPDLRANMTKALDLLQVLTSTKYTDRAFVEAVDEADEMLEQLRGKVVMKGLADQQEVQAAAHGDEAPGTVRVTAAWLKKVHRDLDACQKVIWLAGCRPRVPGGFDPAYCEDAQERLKEIDEQIARAQAAEGAQHA